MIFFLPKIENYYYCGVADDDDDNLYKKNK